MLFSFSNHQNRISINKTQKNCLNNFLKIYIPLIIITIRLLRVKQKFKRRGEY